MQRIFFIFTIAILQMVHVYGQQKLTTAAVIAQLKNNLVLVPGDTFSMGCTNEQGDECLVIEQPSHTVRVDTFYISKYDVTQWQWETVMGKNPSHFKNCDDCPVESVSWNDVQQFIVKLNQLSGGHYRLPTEAEWEYAARGGNKSERYKYAGSDNLPDVAWYLDNSGDSTHPVGKKDANELGLYDMAGNVWQWCNDWYDDQYYNISPDNNPQGPDNGQYRSVRGSSWSNMPKYNRISLRRKLDPNMGDSHGGFRLAQNFH